MANRLGKNIPCEKFFAQSKTGIQLKCFRNSIQAFYHVCIDSVRDFKNLTYRQARSHSVKHHVCSFFIQYQ